MNRKRAYEWLVIGSLLMVACGGQGEGQPTAGTTAGALELDTRQRQLRILDEVDQAIQGSYVFEDYGGVDWVGEVGDLRQRTERGLSDGDFYAALEALVSTLPQGTASYLTREERIASELEDTTVYQGIGAFVAVRAEPEPRVVLLSVMEGSPAEAAGLRAHDAIYAIDGRPVGAEEGIAVLERVRGPEGTQVILEVASPGGPRREVAVTRARLSARDTLRGRLLDSGVVYILVPVAADTSLLDTVLRVLQSMAGQTPTRGLILDLRVAHSSTSWPLSPLLTLFGDGYLGSFYSRDQRSPVELTGQDFFGSQNIPLAILIGPDTMGTPEILAAALQASGRATLVGLPSPGQILAFEQRTLEDGSQLIYAASSYETAQGQDLARSGVSPDVRVDADWDQVSPEADPVLDAAEQLLLAEGDRSNHE